ncbi:phage minor head protein [Polaromonas sp.]|uniref:phage head morphogenesis protein n=1 Tax=Polaromonas sp. TaxID=1869339 RepID=UPI00286B1DE8|nr:phage minor head protein [Polaromonas sp.]
MADPVTARDFGVQFQGAIDNLKGKLPESTLAWDDLAGPVHGKVFAVSGAVKIDLVSDLHKSLVSGLEKGTTITQFRKDFDAAVQKHGWTYKGKRGWRTAVIFNNNMRSAHMAGRWEQLLANQANRPYLQYRTAGDSRVRPQHRAWNGLIFPIGDSFWQTHYPPNGWGCRCTIRAYSDADLKHLGVTASPKFDLKTRQVVSQDGEIKDQVPVGIDPGWDHNVGQSWIAPELALGQKLAALPRFLQGPLVDKTISPAFQKVMNADFKAFRNAIKQPKGDAQIVGFFDSATLQALADKLPQTELKSTAAAVFDRKTVHLSGTHKAIDAPQQVWPDAWIDSLPENFRNYRAVLLDKTEGTLIVVPQGGFNDRLPKIVLRLNQKTNLGSAASVVSLGSAKAVNLKDVTQYELLLGDLGR